MMDDIRPPGVTYEWCTEGSTKGLSEAIEKLYRELPGWWFSVGNCHVSADATIGPDRTGPDRHLLRFEEFDHGIDGSLLHPATLTDALLQAIENGKAAKEKYTKQTIG
ncbi:MAG: hypothetical protein KGL39_53920 [Patescibacteria group bacterium]|nr:hypothetical protein [Patescibacteria group bacterium]